MPFKICVASHPTFPPCVLDIAVRSGISLHITKRNARGSRSPVAGVAGRRSFRPATERPCGRIALASSDYEPSRAAKTYTGGNDENNARKATVCPTQHSTPQLLVAARRRLDRRARSGRRGDTDGARAAGRDRLQHVPGSEQRNRSKGRGADEDDRGVRASESEYQGARRGGPDG